MFTITLANGSIIMLSLSPKNLSCDVVLYIPSNLRMGSVALSQNLDLLSGLIVTRCILYA